MKQEIFEKKAEIAKRAATMLEQSYKEQLKKVNKLLDSSAIDVDQWDVNNNAMILPKCIVIAILEDEADQYKANGTSFEKQVNAEVKNLKLYI